MIVLINKERTKENLLPLEEDSVLNFLAHQRVLIILSSDDFSHAATKSGKTYVYFANALGYPYRYLGENLAARIENSEEIIYRWMASSKHKDNILSSNFRDVGIAKVEDIIVVIFGALLF